MKKEYIQIQACYRNLFNTPDGKKVLADLDTRYNQSLLKKAAGAIDPSAALVAIGSREVLVHIHHMRKDNAPS